MHNGNILRICFAPLKVSFGTVHTNVQAALYIAGMSFPSSTFLEYRHDTFSRHHGSLSHCCSDFFVRRDTDTYLYVLGVSCCGSCLLRRMIRTGFFPESQSDVSKMSRSHNRTRGKLSPRCYWTQSLMKGPITSTWAATISMDRSMDLLTTYRWGLEQRIFSVQALGWWSVSGRPSLSGAWCMVHAGRLKVRPWEALSLQGPAIIIVTIKDPSLWYLLGDSCQYICTRLCDSYSTSESSTR